MPVLAPSPNELWVSADPSQHHLEIAATQSPDVFAIRDTSAQSASSGGERVTFATIGQTEAALGQMKQLQRQQQQNGGSYNR